MRRRDYQVEALNNLRENYEKGLNRQLGRMFTGGGKTTGIATGLPVWFEDIFKMKGNVGGMAFIAHRREILFQSYKKFKQAFPNLWIGLEMGEQHATGYEDIIFISVQSLSRLDNDRLQKYIDREFGIYVVDEGHHVESKNSWDNILSFFGIGSRRTEKLSDGRIPLLLFLTATPTKKGELLVRPFIDCIGFDYPIKYGIDNGWLVDIICYTAEPSKPLTNEEEEVLFACKIYERHLHDKLSLIFTKSVSQSVALTNALLDLGYNGMHIDANTSKDDRDVVLPKFEEKEIDFISNRLVFTEGYDNRNIQAILDLANTSNVGLLEQKIGRGLRPSVDARVDDYETATERKQAILKSSKPSLLYVTTYPIDAGILNTSKIILGGLPLPKDEEKTLSEIYDVVSEYEKKQPLKPPIEFERLSDFEAYYKSVDLFSETVYSEEMVAVSYNRWIRDDGWIGIFLPSNPKPKNDFERTPVIYLMVKVNDRQWAAFTIIYGGWVEELGFPVAARFDFKGFVTDPFKVIRAVDKKLSDYEDLYKIRRKIDGPATKRQLSYMNNNKILHSPNVTAEVAQIQIDHYRIKRKLDTVKKLLEKVK